MTGTLFDGVIGAMVGDALGVPVEFMERDSYPSVTGMTGFGTHNQPLGTWSDDSSMIIATLDSMCRLRRTDPTDIMENFSSWICYGKFTPYGTAFDVGGATMRAISRYQRGTEAAKCGGRTNMDNGNGALMRILPVAVMDPDMVLPVANLTHAHFISDAVCIFYKHMVMRLMSGSSGIAAYCSACVEYGDMIRKYSSYAPLRRLVDLHYPVYEWKRYEVNSTGYVVDTLEAALWCFLRNDNYADTVLDAVNLGGDTDTIGSVAGGLAGLFWGHGAIPFEWAYALPYMKDVWEMCLECERTFQKELKKVENISSEELLAIDPADPWFNLVQDGSGS